MPLLAIVLAVASVCSPPPEAPDVVVVCPEPFRAALAPWAEYRSKQGHRLAWLPGNRPAKELQKEIRRIAKLGKLRFIVLVGDAAPATKPPARYPLRVPTFRIPAKVNLYFGSEPVIATDNGYADLDDDQVPDVAIGRLTADTAEELTIMVDKILAYEQCPNFGLWRRRVNFVAGAGGFGAAADSIIEAVTGRLIDAGMPGSYALSMTYANDRSSFCPEPQRFCETTIARLAEGCLFWVYMGHGQHRGLGTFETDAGHHPILEVEHLDRVQCDHGTPIALMLACYTGAFDLADNCLAEEMLCRRDTPLAVIAGSRVTMPYGMSVLGAELMQECFLGDSGPKSLGETLLAAKRRLAADDQSPWRAALKLIAVAASPTRTMLAEERLEHVQLFNLLGDPLLRVPCPRAAQIATSARVRAGDTLEIHGISDLAGRCTVELVSRRSWLSGWLGRPEAGSDNSPADDPQETYQRANNLCLATAELAVEPGKFLALLQIPEEARGAFWVRVFIEGQDSYALGSQDLIVEPHTAPSEQTP